MRLILEDKEGILILYAADNGIEAVEKVIQYQPDFILMNFHLTEKDGVQATKEIKEANPETKVILLTSEYEEDNLSKGLIYGADGILHNKIESDSLERAIKTVNEGDTILSKVIANGLRHEIYKLIINKKKLLNE